MNDDAGFHVFHAACAVALATDIIVDLYTFFRPPARELVLLRGQGRWYPVSAVIIERPRLCPTRACDLECDL